MQLRSTEVKSLDDEVGYKLLAITSKGTNGSVFHNRDRPMAGEVPAMAGHDLPIARMPRNRSKYLASLKSVLKVVVPPDVIAKELMSDILLDYEAWIRVMVNNDDEIEKTEGRTFTSGARQMRLRSQRDYNYERWITLSGEQRGTLRDTAIRVKSDRIHR